MKRIWSWIWWDIKDACRVKTEKLQMWVAWKLPKWLVKWAAVRLISHATTGQYGKQLVPALGAMEALKRWDTA